MCLTADPTHVSVQALFGHLTLDVIILTVLYSLAGLGIAIVNDFKSIEGDRYAERWHAKCSGVEQLVSHFCCLVVLWLHYHLAAWWQHIRYYLYTYTYCQRYQYTHE